MPSDIKKIYYFEVLDEQRFSRKRLSLPLPFPMLEKDAKNAKVPKRPFQF